MHDIEPYYHWNQYYEVAEDELSPYFGKEYNHDLYTEEIYGFFIDPAWDYMGSETLYNKILFVDYERSVGIIELIGEWNDALNNDVMHLKRNLIEPLMYQRVNKFILIGENVLNFHGSDDCYYEEWADEVEDIVAAGTVGWIAAVNFREHVLNEMEKYGLDSYINCGGTLQIKNWRTMHPNSFFELVDRFIQKRLYLPE